MIVATDTRYNGGLGDAVWMSWLGEAAKDTADPIAFHTTSPAKRELFAMLGQTVSDDYATAIDTSPAYEREISDGGTLARWLYATQLLGRPCLTPTRPTVSISEFDRQWIAEKFGAKRRPLAVMFPESNCAARTWPLACWMDLSELLYRDGFYPVAVSENRYLDGRFRAHACKLAVPRLTGLIERAAVVVGNDSFGVHLAVTIGTRTVCLLGPTTRVVVFGHCDPNNPVTVTSDAPCTGCMSGRQWYRASCQEACQSLMLLTPDRVLRAVASL